MKVDAEAAGMDEKRLERIEEHLRTRYTDPGKIAGCQVAVVRRGVPAYYTALGWADRERQAPVGEDTVWRIYSMTKPITAVALMTLYERGLFQLTDPVSRFIPEWRDLKVQETGPDGAARLVEPRRPMQIRDLLTHTAGLGYGPGNSDLVVVPVGSRGEARSLRMDHDLEAMVARLAETPLRFHPGTHWLYSLGIDVCGRLIEIMSGRRLDRFLEDEIFAPLGMADTAFSVAEAARGRLAACYARNSSKELVLADDPAESTYLEPPSFLAGGGGLVSTLGDYIRFCRMLLGGGELDGRRVLGRKTVELMTVNHLPGGASMAEMSLTGGYGEVGFEGMGFGLSMAVGQGPAATGLIGSPGEYMWGGAASTTFWIDPAEELIVVFMTQLLPSGTFDFRGQLKTLVYPAITD
ncbi:MAG TPA: serine hydrolase domain-containing protein [Acidimicrobiales bacterium]|nr:serine hydrolase domain-containing protein [Acidimicrobiales bacterium]